MLSFPEFCFIAISITALNVSVGDKHATKIYIHTRNCALCNLVLHLCKLLPNHFLNLYFSLNIFFWSFQTFRFAATGFKVCGFAGSTGKRPQSRKPIKWGESTESRLSFATLDLESTNRNQRSSKSIPFFILFTFSLEDLFSHLPVIFESGYCKKKSTGRVGSNHI